LIEGYDEALAGEDIEDGVRGSRPEAVQIVMKRAVGRKWAHLAKESIEDASPTIPLGKRFWPLTRKEKAEISDLFAGEEVRRLVTALRSRKSDARVEMLDAAYWVKGCSSLGRLRYALLLGVGKDHFKEGALCLMDIKEADGTRQTQ
jgi:uncharacterized protein (DUF2252 family)